MSTISLVYIIGVAVCLILMLLIYSYFNNHKEYGEVVELEGFGCLMILSWITVILLIVGYRKQIKEMLLIKRNDNTKI
jgi:uncharacterized membrane protein YdjX (TVP38/TMEM64 family)